MLEGNKIRLRALQRKDFNQTYKWHNDLDLKNLTLSHPFPVTDVMEEKWIIDILEDKSNRNIYFGIENKNNNELVGIIFLSGINNIHQTCWLGILIGENEARGKGFGTEAIKLIIDYAFNNLNLRKVSLEVVNSNKTAIETYKKIGFNIEGEMKMQVYINGILFNNLIMSIFKEH